MYLNTLSPGKSKSVRKRVGRGIGSGFGKTCGRGHKGQKARSGGFNKLGFEGGQMPIQRRLPKSGFSSRVGRVTDEIRLSEIEKLDDEVIDLAALHKAGLINSTIKHVKIIASGSINRAVKVSGLRVTKGAHEAIKAAGGSIVNPTGAGTSSD